MAVQNQLPPLPSSQGGITVAPKGVAPQGSSGGNGQAKPGQVSIGWSAWFKAVDTLLRSGNFGTILQLLGATVLTTAGGATLTGGFNEQVFDNGTPAAASTITPKPSKGLKQKVTNNAAFTIAATSEVGDLELLVINGASAGAITLSGFTKQFPSDAFDTVNGHMFLVFIYGIDGTHSAVVVKALQ